MRLSSESPKDMTRYSSSKERNQAQAYSRYDARQETDCGCYWLDIQYKAFRDDIDYVRQDYKKQLKRTRRELSQSKHRVWEAYEIENGSTWRNTYLRDLSEESRECFEANRETRYNIWLHMHHDAIDALKGHFVRSGYVKKSDNIRKILLDLWNFLPQEFYKFGTGKKLQKRQVEWLTGKTDLSRRLEIDEFLERLVENFCSQDRGELTNRMRLFEGGSEGDLESVSARADRDKLMKDMLESGAYKTLVKRLLLQTPLLLWPAFFKPGVSLFFEGYVKPCDVLYSTEGDLVVVCFNMQLQGGYEVYALWSNLLKYEESAKISRCTRAHELRWEQVPDVPLYNTRTDRSTVEDHGNVTKRVIWRPKIRYFDAI